MKTQKDTQQTHQIMTNTASQPYTTARLAAPCRQRAVGFIMEYGNPLQQARLAYHLPADHLAGDHGAARTSPAAVLEALQTYQNPDGGFGHGLEPDIRTGSSSVIATTVGLQILQSLDEMESTSARAAVQYLANNLIDGTWRCIDATANDAPHAPWWLYQHPNTAGGFAVNPSVECIGYLLQSIGKLPVSEAATKARDALPGLLQHAINYIQQQDLDMHELQCYVRLYENPALDQGSRDALLPYLLCNAFKLVKVDPTDWEEYCLTPLSIISGPNSVFADFFADSLDANLTFQLHRQQESGGWPSPWSWGGEFPATWKVVEPEIRAELTLQSLLQFAAFDRLD